MSSVLDVAKLFSVHGKVALVTGGGSGIGLMITKALVSNGCKVYIASRKINEITKVAQELNMKHKDMCVAVQQELGTKKQASDLAAQMQILERSGKLDILVNNSGMSWGGTLENFDEESGWDKLMALNLKSVFYVTTSLLPMLTKAANGNTDPSRVVNISSVLGSINTAESPLTRGGMGTWSYNASKAAVDSLTRTMATSLAQNYVTVNAIAPGFFPSRMTKFGIMKNGEILTKLQPLKRLGCEQDMAGLILFLCSKAGAHVNGAVIPLDGGQSLSQTRANL